MGLEAKSSELLDQLETQLNSTFEKHISYVLKRRHELNLLESTLKDRTLTPDKNEDHHVHDKFTTEKLESLNIKEKLETACEKNNFKMTKILQEKCVVESEIKCMEKKIKDSDTNVKKMHKNLMRQLKRYQNCTKSYVATNKSDPDVFTVYFFTEKKPSNDNFLVKMKLKDGNIELIHTIPELPRMDEIASHLAATRDIQGFMYCVYKNFILLQNK